MAPHIVSERLEVQDSTNKTRIILDANEGQAQECEFRIRRNAITLHDSALTSRAGLVFFDEGSILYLCGNTSRRSIDLDGKGGDITVYGKDGKRSLALRSSEPSLDGITGVWFGGSADPSEGPKAAKVFIRDSAGTDSIILDGAAGDIILNNADCAEDFDMSDLEEVEPGTVMVIENEGKLGKCSVEYDKRVAGVVSGAGDCKPALILDKRKSNDNRKPLALMGKVFCKTEATHIPVEVGDLLTTSSIQGYAMKASDPIRAFGAVIGKALRPLKTGKDIIPILVTLQ